MGSTRAFKKEFPLVVIKGCPNQLCNEEYDIVIETRDPADATEYNFSVRCLCCGVHASYYKSIVEALGVWNYRPFENKAVIAIKNILTYPNKYLYQKLDRVAHARHLLGLKEE